MRVYHIPVAGIVRKGTVTPSNIIVWDSCRIGLAAMWLYEKER